MGGRVQVFTAKTTSKTKSLVLVLWATVLCFGFGKLFLYSNTPGQSARAAARWPDSATIKRDPKLATLLVFAHPHCPCSVATVGELERLMPHLKERVQSFVMFFEPSKKGVNWARDSLWEKAQAIPGVQTAFDEDGATASLFGASTSGQTFLYDADGKLVFSGGITPERGHMGDSVGRDAIMRFVKTGSTKPISAPVFGCSLRNPERSIAAEKK